MKDEIAALVDKANRSLAASKRMIEAGDYDFAVSRAYYALFYVSEALLLKKGKSFSKHAAVISGLYEEYIKTNELPKEFHKTLHRAFDLRQQGDYLSSVEIPEDVARHLIKDVELHLDHALMLI